MADRRAVLPGLGMKIIPLLPQLFPRGSSAAAVGRMQLRQRAKSRKGVIAGNAWARPQRKSA